MVLYVLGIIVFGFFVGVLSGLLGVGGGTFMVAFFTLALNMPGVTATGTSLFTIIPTSLSGMIERLRSRSCAWRFGLIMGLAGACTSPVGVWLAQLSPEWLVMCTVAAVILYSAITMLQKALAKPKPEQETSNELPKITLPLFCKIAFIGLITGMASGFVGLGGGFIMIPLMSTMLKFPMKLASGTSLLGIVCIAIPGTITQALYGSVDFLVGILIACGSIPGAILGAKLVNRFNDRVLRFMFSGVLAVTAIVMVVRTFI